MRRTRWTHATSRQRPAVRSWGSALRTVGIAPILMDLEAVWGWHPMRRATSGPAHRAKKTKAFVETLGGQLMLFFFPPYSPDRNPDELVWKHLKADTVGRMATTSKVDFKEKICRFNAELAKTP